jgi:hypothetical protein
MSTNVQQGIKSITLEAKVIRVNGDVEDLGPVAEYQSDSKKRSSLLGNINILNTPLYQRYLRSA